MITLEVSGPDEARRKVWTSSLVKVLQLQGQRVQHYRDGRPDGVEIPVCDVAVIEVVGPMVARSPCPIPTCGYWKGHGGMHSGDLDPRMVWK